MKFAIAILAVLAVARPLSALKLPASGSGVLAKEIQSQLDGIPFDQIVPIFMLYAANENDVHAALQILQSDEFKLFVQDVEEIPEIKNLLNYTEEAGLDVRTLIDKLTEVLDLEHISPLEASPDADTLPELTYLLKYVQEAGIDNVTLQNRLNDYLNLEKISLPKEYGGPKCGGFARLYNAFMYSYFLESTKRGYEKLETSEALDDFSRECRKLELPNIYLSFRSNKHYVKVIQEAEKAGIYYEQCWKLYPLIMLAKIALALTL